MDIFSIAIQIEKEGAAFYHELASKAATKGLGTIFTMLSEDEEKHQQVFMTLKQNSVPVMVASTATEKAKSIFKNFKKEDFKKETEQLKLYERALDVEKKSIEFYSSQLENLESEETRKTVKAILNEEKHHYAMLEEIVKLVNRPNSWVENAEFGIREDY
ncbi:ferritin family protein [uncultured Sphaerochaeta sp.]|uniref:ferritin family protein n=1 Tax=uncultured Sphaerochaeta sp. TaxID=886478 RepID=UPI002A0A5EBE|nr:ferritin family protein [uncultured Sphaerochaeta sp.]